jgi:hypothetical protein
VRDFNLPTLLLSATPYRNDYKAESLVCATTAGAQPHQVSRQTSATLEGPCLQAFGARFKTYPLRNTAGGNIAERTSVLMRFATDHCEPSLSNLNCCVVLNIGIAPS